MNINAQFGIAASELRLRDIAAANANDPLRLPTKMRYLAAGGEAALTQLILTWAQKSQTRKLQTFITSTDDPNVVEISRRLFGMTAVLSARSVSGVPNDLDVSDVVSKACIERLTQIQSAQPKAAYRGPSIEIVCADHIARSQPYLRYQPSVAGRRKLRSRSNYKLLAGWLIRNTVPEAYIGAVDEEADSAIGGMLYEVFKNTEVHGLVNAWGDILDISVRGLKTSHLSPTPVELARIVADYAPLGEYCQSLEPPAGGAQLHLFELSVIDSGPGFASSWTKRPLDDLSPDEEERAVRECFLRGSSSGRDRFGEGLPHVIRLLQREKGFLRLRTGRMSFFADFSKPQDEQLGAEFLQRWVPDDNLPLAPVSGSVLTIIVPMRRRS